MVAGEDAIAVVGSSAESWSGRFSSAPLGGSVHVLFEQPGDVLQNPGSGQFATVMVFSKKPVEGDPVLSTEVGVDVVLNQFRGLMTSKDARSEAVERLSTACSSLEKVQKVAASRTTTSR
jgi:tripartite-type tricarboxylate transporter receptor subunit TctC